MRARVIDSVGPHCSMLSSVSGTQCLLPEGHPQDSPTRFHRFTSSGSEEPSTEAHLARVIVRAAKAVAAQSPVVMFGRALGACNYCDGDVPDAETGFIHDNDCKWFVLANAVANYNVNVRPVRAMYERLAAEYEAHPAVPDRRGGVIGDKSPF